MVENQKNMTIDLHIKTLCMKVMEHTPVYVVWQRGNKKAKTKSRLLNENVSQAVIDEKFQISTIMEVNEEGVPTKDKMSKLTIAGDKGKGVLGEADLNLSDYQENEFKIFKLTLKNCVDPDAFIEVGLRASVAREKTPRNRESNTSQQKDQVMALVEDLDKERKVNIKLKRDCEERIKNLNEKINDLQTQLENTKTDLASIHKQKKGWTGEKEEKEKLQKQLQQKIQIREGELLDREYEIKKLRETIKTSENEQNNFIKDLERQRDLKTKEVNALNEQYEAAKADMRLFYGYEKFDFSYVVDAIFFNNGEQGAQTGNQVVVTTPGTRNRGRA